MTSISRQCLNVPGCKSMAEAEEQAQGLMKAAMTISVYYRLLEEHGGYIALASESPEEDSIGEEYDEVWDEAKDIIEAGVTDDMIEAHFKYNYFIVVNEEGLYLPMMGPVLRGRPVKTTEDGLGISGIELTNEQVEAAELQFEDDVNDMDNGKSFGSTSTFITEEDL